MKTSKQQITIDSLLVTHSEPTRVDAVNHEVYGSSKGEICLKIKNSENWYTYTILANGEITERVVW